MGVEVVGSSWDPILVLCSVNCMRWRKQWYLCFIAQYSGLHDFRESKRSAILHQEYVLSSCVYIQYE